MKFPKDILVIDFEGTTPDPQTAQPIQLAALLLDKDTLQEKDSLKTYIQADLAGGDPESLDVSGIKQEDLANAPTAAEAGKILYDKFGQDVFLSSWVENMDRRLLRKIMDAANLPYLKYDYHFLDLWPVAYVYLLKNGYSGSAHSEDMFQALGLKKRTNHDALEDCRLAAEALRKILS